MLLSGFSFLNIKGNLSPTFLSKLIFPLIFVNLAKRNKKPDSQFLQLKITTILGD